MPPSSYHIWRSWASVPTRPIFLNLEPLRILTEISHTLFMTFGTWASFWPCFVIRSPCNPFWNTSHTVFWHLTILTHNASRPLLILSLSKSLLKYDTFSVCQLPFLGLSFRFFFLTRLVWKKTLRVLVKTQQAFQNVLSFLVELNCSLSLDVSHDWLK